MCKAAGPFSTKIGSVTESCVAASLTIEGYQVVVDSDDGSVIVELPADATSLTVPPEFLVLGTDYKFEVLAIEESGNQTITEAEFTTP